MIITATCWHQHCSGTICRQLSGHEWQVCFDPWPDDTGIWKIRDARSRLFDVLRSSQLLAPVPAFFPAFFPACRHVLPTSVLALTGWWLLHLQLGSYRWTQWPSCHSRCQPWIFKSCGLTSFGQMQFWSEGWSCKRACKRSRRKAFLKHVAFGVNPSEYYVHSEWGTHWTQSGSCDVFRNRKAAGNSTVASYASFGPNHQYYIEFSDRWRYWKIDDAEIERLVKENSVKFVSFGPQGAFFLALRSGAYYFRHLAFI